MTKPDSSRADESGHITGANPPMMQINCIESIASCKNSPSAGFLRLCHLSFSGVSFLVRRADQPAVLIIAATGAHAGRVAAMMDR